ncbi:MAG: hypothetical protein QXT43_00520, partial [Candidatus Micrarchaeaceae archaeon]
MKTEEMKGIITESLKIARLDSPLYALAASNLYAFFEKAVFKYEDKATAAKTYDAAIAHGLKLSHDEYDAESIASYTIAALVADRFGLGEEKVVSAAQRACSAAARSVYRLSAASIAKRFGTMKKEEITELVSNEYSKCFKEGDYSSALDIAANYSQELGEEKLADALAKYCETKFKEGRPDLAEKYATELWQKLGKEGKEKIIQVAKEAYKTNIENGKYKDAIYIAERFKLGNDLVKKAEEQFLNNSTELDPYEYVDKISEDRSKRVETIKKAANGLIALMKGDN